MVLRVWRQPSGPQTEEACNKKYMSVYALSSLLWSKAEGDLQRACCVELNAVLRGAGDAPASKGASKGAASKDPSSEDGEALSPEAQDMEAAVDEEKVEPLCVPALWCQPKTPEGKFSMKALFSTDGAKCELVPDEESAQPKAAVLLPAVEVCLPVVEVGDVDIVVRSIDGSRRLVRKSRLMAAKTASVQLGPVGFASKRVGWSAKWAPPVCLFSPAACWSACVLVLCPVHHPPASSTRSGRWRASSMAGKHCVTKVSIAPSVLRFPAP